MQNRTPNPARRGRWRHSLLAILNSLFGHARAPAEHGGVRFLRARYDAAQTTHENRRHWANADHLSANAAASPEVRRILRSRARYEVANNSYAKGIVLTLANYVVGTGPRLQMLTDDPKANRIIEREFARWAKAVGLAHKLRTMRVAQCENGECFGLLATNPRIEAPVQLDVRLIEADQVTTPWPTPRADANVVDGIVFDGFGNPVAYTILRHHPGDVNAWRSGRDYDVLPAESVVHLFRAERPGQNRGIPEMSNSLSLVSRPGRDFLDVRHVGPGQGYLPRLLGPGAPHAPRPPPRPGATRTSGTQAYRPLDFDWDSGVGLDGFADFVGVLSAP